MKRDSKKRWWLVMRLRDPKHRTAKDRDQWFESMHGPTEGFETEERAYEALEETKRLAPDGILQYKVTTEKPI